ncbi:putative BOI-related E3 ubiquitin-protein ligase 3 [Abeliophyllum distichum]|uniref:BOI-related E3 ubiquitin-protein ligase 3 n=1 Tax=Abeliophyllum distichum TaxID=126358 RepID=A0ABD1SBA9_9LAMI
MANTLRCNLEQVLAQAHCDENQHHRFDEALAYDAQSCYDINFEQIERCKCYCNSSRNRFCKNCGKDESFMLLLLCRHLCLCIVCRSSVHTCPICNSSKTTSLNVNLIS